MEKSSAMMVRMCNWKGEMQRGDLVLVVPEQKCRHREGRSKFGDRLASLKWKCLLRGHNGEIYANVRLRVLL